MENYMRKKNIEELQAELALESEALATLQIIYAEKVKQVRTNTALPPDIQARFLAEWETFYQQRVASIFRKDYLSSSAQPVGEQAVSIAPPAQPKPPMSAKASVAQPQGQPAPSPLAPPVAAASPEQSTTGEDILGVNTDSWMNSAESLTYEQYGESEQSVSSLMDSDKVQIPSGSLDTGYNDDPDSIDGYAATSGLKGLTEFMDFDLKKKKS